MSIDGKNRGLDLTYNAKQIDFSVGYGIYDVPRMTGVYHIGNVRWEYNISAIRYVDKQWRLANHRLSLFLERCCMGVVSQIIDLDNSSSAVPYRV